MENSAVLARSVDLLKAMIATPSVSRDEAAVADLLERYMHQCISELPAHQQPVHGRHLNNNWLIAPGFDPQRKTLLLNAHCDTVKPASSWSFEPFAATEVTSRIYGLGSNDDGASLVSLLHVFIELCKTSQTYNLIFVASAEEEVSGDNGIASVLPLLPKIDVALVGEPTGMRLAVAEKGLVVMDGVAHGKAGHAARNEGVNALYLALDAINQLRNVRFEKESAMLGPVKVTVTNLQAGQGQHNVVPDVATFIVDVRTTDAYSNEEVVELLRAALSPSESPQKGDFQFGTAESVTNTTIPSIPSIPCSVTLIPRSTRLQPSGIALEHPLVRRIQEVCPGIELFGSPTLSDQSRMNFPSLKMGPGESSRSHTADEYICTSEIADALQKYYNILNGLTL